MMQDNCPLRLRKPTPRNKLERSAHKARTAPALSLLGLMVTTRKMAARVSLLATDCETGGGKLETIFDPFVWDGIPELQIPEVIGSICKSRRLCRPSSGHWTFVGDVIEKAFYLPMGAQMLSSSRLGRAAHGLQMQFPSIAEV